MTSPIFILTITDVEYLEVKKRFITDEVLEEQDFNIEIGTLCDRPCVLFKCLEMGSRAKGSVSHYLARALELTNPVALIELGIAFSLKDEIHIGDVCLSRMAVDYEYQKVNSDGIQNRGRQADADTYLVNQLTTYAKRSHFKFNVVDVIYASGDKVVNDPKLKEIIQRLIPDAKAGDMESYSVGVICGHKEVPWIVVKGISDDGINKGDEFQILATKNSVDFICDAISNDVLSKLIQIQPSNKSKFLQSDYDRIAEEVYKQKWIKPTIHKTYNFTIYAYAHPVLLTNWSIVFIDTARSVPEAIRYAIKQIGRAPAQIDICLCVEDVTVTENRVEGYVSLLKELGCQGVYVKPIREFVFDRVVKSCIDSSENASKSRIYIDQKIYIEQERTQSGGSFVRDFLGLNGQGSAKPICVILGQGGVGKTTLCGNVVNLINTNHSQEKLLLLITKNDIARNYSGERISSVLDLYRIFIKGEVQFASPISEQSFDLAFRCGSIVLVIDGIDEIESYCGTQFCMDQFTDSILSLHENIGSCKAILTSRQVDVERFSDIDKIDLVFLKGFNDSDVNEYFKKSSIEFTQKLRSLVGRIRTQQGLVNPYLLRLLVDRDKSSDCDDADIRTERLNLNDPFEYMLCRVLLREIEKQTLGISIDDYYDLLEWLVLDSLNNATESEFESYLDTMLTRGVTDSSDSLKKAYLKLFLLRLASNHVSVTESEFVSIILLKRMVSIFEATANPTNLDIKRAINIFSRDYRGELGVLSKLNNELILPRDDLLARSSAILKLIKSEYLQPSCINEKRAIYSLHKFVFGYLKIKGQQETTLALVQLHGSTTINSLFVFGDFPSIDFSGLTVNSSEFINHDKFLMSQFGSDTKFISCLFTGCSSRYKKGRIPRQIFDETCRMDEAFKNAINSLNSKADDLAMSLRTDVKAVLNSMRQGLGFMGRSINKIKLTTRVVDARGYQCLLDEMSRLGVLKFEPGDSLYSVTPEFEREALELCEENALSGCLADAVNDLIKTVV